MKYYTELRREGISYIDGTLNNLVIFSRRNLFLKQVTAGKIDGSREGMEI